MNKRHLLSSWVLVLSLMTIPGCETASKPNYASLGLVEISGTVLLNGNPLTNAEIRFETESDGIYSFGVTDSNGKYRLMFDSRTPGIIPGPKIVRVFGKPSASEKMAPTTPGVPEYRENEEGESEGGDDQEGADPDVVGVQAPTLPEAYGKKSQIRVEVTGPDPSFDFDLLTDGSTTGRK